MDPQSEIHATEQREGALSEVCNGNISGRVEVSNGLAEGNGNFWDLPAFKIPEMKLGNLEKVSTLSLFTIVKKILDDRFKKKDEDIPQRVASVLKLVVQEIEQRVSKQADNMRKQSRLYKSHEDRYLSKIRVLETLATGTSEENEVVVTQLQQMKIKIEENKKHGEQELIKLRKEKGVCESQILSLKEKVTLAQTSYEENILQLESKAEESKDKLEKKILNIESLLTDSRKKVKELEDSSESKLMRWKRKEQRYRQFIDSKVVSVQELRLASESIKHEVLKIKNVYAEEFYNFGLNLKGLVEAAENYHSVLDENRKLYNEVQDLKGNIRVYCRVRPFLSGQSAKQTTMQYLGENGELVVMNPSKPGKESHRLFKFNKVFGPASTQEEVFRDTQPLIRSVLDGYNVCIFAYGQTGSGKTYTMTGPNLTSVADWGVNYRALNDLFNISQRRHSSIAYEIVVQMVEIYNEQVPVPDASLHPVKSTDDVLELMSVGLMNRAVGATALNERSSRSHSILTVHVRGTDLETNAVLRGCLHLVDLAGSERVDRSEATGDRLREAQHINKSLSALGDVIFALAQKNAHVPYRNSKLTQVLQSSLGGQAKTLMFVQLNPDVESYSETISTLKFAERVSGVELGAARSNKESRGVRELMEQVTSLKNAVAKKDEEIGRLRLLKASGDGERRSLSSVRCGSASPRRHSAGARPSPKVSQGKSSSEKVATDEENNSEYSDKHSEAGSQQSVDEFKHHKEFFRQSRLSVLDADKFPDDNSLNIDVVDREKYPNDDIELLGLGEDDSEERLSDISDGVLSMGTETEGSINSIVEYTLFPEKSKPSRDTTEKPGVPGKHLKPPMKQVQAGSARLALSKSASKIPSYRGATTAATGGSSSAMKPSKRWH
ncbi:kinesin-like protein KIN-14J [Salvia divinorum]|uniref:Kinesin-like protein KIN-14J n=1 Tax=Salvia divinorum TaxID=28513 RepID=A0ABD1FLJ7_SALDI